jgi:hypothetical protein
MESYPLLNFLVTHGRKLALALGMLTLALGFVLSLEQSAWSWTFLGAVGGLVVFLFVASYAELVRLVTDMLLPK